MSTTCLTDEQTTPTPAPVTAAPAQDRGRSTSVDARTEALIMDHLDLARKLAHRYSGRGEPVEELVQVAMVGLVQAAGRFDPERGTSFSAYAVPTILGELRRYFRDHCWTVRVPRPVHDLYLEIQRAQDAMTADQHRTPTVRELATRLGATEEEILEALEGGSAYAAMSLDAPERTSEKDSWTLGDTIGGDDGEFDLVEQREAVRHLLQQVPRRERTILIRWFFGNRTQSAIAEELGISQMHVSRLLANTLSKLRAAAYDPSGEPITWPSQRQRRAS